MEDEGKEKTPERQSEEGSEQGMLKQTPFLYLVRLRVYPSV